MKRKSLSEKTQASQRHISIVREEFFKVKACVFNMTSFGMLTPAKKRNGQNVAQ